ncbi:amphi-Trp domain-containing protein [Streptomyces sp. NPDC046712]|uniref:amphi-Trp domain-containing protein n=1 Tax=Streptomyces sp. NPDC046712 TaxID=3154802 RepID=UPI0033CB7186
MKDLKFEQKRSLSRTEAADQLAALAAALRKGGEAELELGSGTLSLRIPDTLRSEVELEVEGGEIELEIELTWQTGSGRKASAKEAASVTKPARSRKSARSAKSAGAEKPAGAAKSAGAEKPASAAKPEGGRKAAPSKSSRSAADEGTKTKRAAAKEA